MDRLVRTAVNLKLGWIVCVPRLHRYRYHKRDTWNKGFHCFHRFVPIRKNENEHRANQNAAAESQSSINFNKRKDQRAVES